MTKSQLIAISEKNLERTGELIRSADQKVSILMATLTLLIAGTIGWLVNKLSSINNFSLLFLLAGILILSYAFLKAVLTIIPRMFSKSNKRSLLFFRDVIKMPKEEFYKRTVNLTEDAYLEDLCSQVYVISRIANTKQASFHDAVILFMVGTFFLLVGFVLFYKIAF